MLHRVIFMLFFSSLSPLSGVGIVCGIVCGIVGVVVGIVGVIVGVGVAVVMNVCGRGLRLLRPAVCDL